ncbi:MAG: hypothetical protein C0478_06520 [Planctomyces sp.]|nr:hypothetical protein [Planctomyces sp.]
MQGSPTYRSVVPFRQFPVRTYGLAIVAALLGLGINGASPASAQGFANHGARFALQGDRAASLIGYNRSAEFESAIRGQSPSPTFEPTYGSTPGAQPGAPTAQFGAPPTNQAPYLAPQGGYQDPFLQYPGNAVPDSMGAYGSPQQSFGVNGPQPFRTGWIPSMEHGYLAPANATGGNSSGNMQIFEIDGELRYNTIMGRGGLFSIAPQFGMRFWDGPLSPNLPGEVYRFGLDMQLDTVPVNGWGVRVGFNPSINTDLDASIGSDAFNWDGTAALVYQASPTFTIVGGLTYWDRVDNFLLPYGGVIWLPSDRWEFQILFPQGKISYFLGNALNGSHWLYVSGGFHAESYQIQMQGPDVAEQIQFTDWRVMLGIRSDHCYYEKFIEVGAVLGREVDFKYGTPNFDLSDTFMARFGIRF